MGQPPQQVAPKTRCYKYQGYDHCGYLCANKQIRTILVHDHDSDDPEIEVVYDLKDGASIVDKDIDEPSAQLVP